MKRLIIAGVLFVSVIIIYLISVFYITNSCDKARQLLNDSVTIYTKNSTAVTEAKKLEDYWDKKEKLLSVFVNHNRIDDIEQAISLLNVYAKNEKDPLFYEYADTVKVLIHQILEDTKITIHSIF
jgi:hypothetical protein